jgi:hypothetical protein
MYLLVKILPVESLLHTHCDAGVAAEAEALELVVSQ